MDPIKTAEKIRADLNDEFDKDLEKVMESSEEKEASGERQKANRAKRRDVFLNALNKLLYDMEDSGEISPEQAGDKREAAARIEAGFSDNPEDDALNFVKAGIAKEQQEKKGEISPEDEKKEKEQEAKKEGTKKGDRYRDEYFEKMKDYKPEKKGGKEASSEAEKEAEAKEKPSWEKLEALRKELEKAREEYIKNDYEMDKKSNKFAKMFGFRAGLGNFKEEIEEYKNNYEEALKKYKDAVIDSEHVEDEEDVEIVARGFIIGENLNRESIRADLEAGEKGWSKTLVKGFNGLTERYRKLSFKQKLLIGASVAGTGFGLSVAGGMAAAGGAAALGKALTSGGALAVGGYRIFSVGVSSVGFSQMFEAWAQKRKGAKAEKEVEKIKDSGFKELESGIEASYEKLKEALDKNIEEANNRIQKEKQWKVWRKYMGVIAGVGMSELSRYLGKEIAEHFQGEAPEITGESGVNKEAIKEGVKGALHNPEYDTLGESGAHKEAIKEQVKQALHNPKFDTLGETAPGAEAAGGLELNTEAVSGVEIAKSGDSIWKMAEHQLENRGYFKGLTGTPEEILAKKTYLIDAIKDKIAENPKDFGLVDADKIQVGQKIDFSSIFENKNDIGNIIDKAESLGRSDIENITRNLAGESSLHGTATASAETPVAETSMKAPAVEIASETEMQNQQLAEIKIARALGLNSHEYSAINDTSVSKLLSEMDKFQELGAKKYIPDLPHDGIYGNPERYKHLRLAEFIKSQLNNVPEGDRLSIKEFLMKVDLESLPEDSVVMAKHISMEMGEEDLKYLAGVLQRETAETIKICAVNIESWNNIKNALVVNSGQNEIVENIKMAVSKVLPEGVAVPSRNDTVENWMIKITKEAYKRGLADDLREQLLRHKT